MINIKSGEPYDVYIGRENGRYRLKRSIWYNPFKIGKDGTREEVIAKYERYLLEERVNLLERLPELKGKVLACWCFPKPCHGDVLLRLAEEQRGAPAFSERGGISAMENGGLEPGRDYYVLAHKEREQEEEDRFVYITQMGARFVPVFSEPEKAEAGLARIAETDPDALGDTSDLLSRLMS